MRVTKAQLLANPRSAALRPICLEFTNISFWIMQRMIRGEATPWAMARWDALVAQLCELGITPEMHSGRSLSENAYAEPALFAEYIAGQCLAVATMTNNRAMLLEANEVHSGYTVVQPMYTLCRKVFEWFNPESEEA